MRDRVAVASAALTGFMSLSYEIVWYRAFSFTTGGSPTVFGALLAAFLLGIAFGSLAVQRFFNPAVKRGDRILLLGLGMMLAAANLVGFLVVPLLSFIVVRAHWSVALPAIGVATAAWGAALPLLSHYRTAPDAAAGQGISQLYLANIIGSSAGALLTGLVLTDHLGVAGLSAGLLILGQAHAGFLLVSALPSRRKVVSAGIIMSLSLGALAAAPWLFHGVFERLQYRRQWHSGLRFTDVVENRSGVITVTPEHEVFGGGAYDGVISTSLVDDKNLIVRAFALSAIHPQPREVLMIGLSTGAWAQVIAHMPGVERLTVIEINPGYLGLVQRYAQVSSLLGNPKVEIIIDDGRRWMARNPHRRFDAIVANTTFHWRSHATNLLSSEYLALARGHLREGGILHYNTTNSDDALKTGLAAFPYGMRILNFATVSDRPIIWNRERFESALREYLIDGTPVFTLSNPQHAQELERIVNLNQDMTSTARYALETREHALSRLTSADIVTDDNMLTEWRRAAVFRLFPTLAK